MPNTLALASGNVFILLVKPLKLSTEFSKFVNISRKAKVKIIKMMPNTLASASENVFILLVKPLKTFN